MKMKQYNSLGSIYLIKMCWGRKSINLSVSKQSTGMNLSFCKTVAGNFNESQTLFVTTKTKLRLILDDDTSIQVSCVGMSLVSELNI